MEELIGREYPYRGRVLSLRLDRVRLPNGNESTREIAEHRGAVAIVAIDSENNVLLVKQYRHAVGRDLLEIQAGTLESNEDASKSAPRELKEETGYSAQRWELLARFYPSPGVLTEEMHLYLARDLAAGASAAEEDEDLHLEKIPLHEALEMVARGEIVDAKSIIGLLLAEKKLGSMMTP